MISLPIAQKKRKSWTASTMISRLVRNMPVLLASLACTLLLAQSAHAQALVNYDVQVANAPSGANDIELVFTFTGGSIQGPYTAVNPPVQNFAGSGANMLVASWTPAFVGGETYEGQFWAIPGIQFNSGDWTADGNSIKDISPADVTLTTLSSSVPEPSSMALMGTSLLAAAFGLRRRICNG
jgi:hypothetical protein